MTKITLTIDLEDPDEAYAPDGRYVTMTEKVLALCEETGRKATFFTVGKAAQAAPNLMKRIVEYGHELAYHSHAHVSLTEETPASFAHACTEDKDRFEQLTGTPVLGFRAPRFSLTPETIWATDVLKEKGFAYSSSIMPTQLSRFGFPNASGKPFRWPSGLLEFPLPVATFGPLRVPYSGGIYLYALPSFVSDYALRRAQADEVVWTYAHPYDLDAGQPYAPMPHTPAWVSVILWLARQRAETKLRHILNNEIGPTLKECAQAYRD